MCNLWLGITTSPWGVFFASFVVTSLPFDNLKNKPLRKDPVILKECYCLATASVYLLLG